MAVFAKLKSNTTEKWGCSTIISFVGCPSTRQISLWCHEPSWELYWDPSTATQRNQIDNKLYKKQHLFFQSQKCEKFVFSFVRFLFASKVITSLNVKYVVYIAPKWHIRLGLVTLQWAIPIHLSCSLTYHIVTYIVSITVLFTVFLSWSLCDSRWSCVKSDKVPQVMSSEPVSFGSENYKLEKSAVELERGLSLQLAPPPYRK